MSSAPHLRPAAQLEYGLRVVLDGAERTRPKIDAELKARIAFDALLAIQKRVCHLEIYPEDALIQEPLQRRFHFISGLPRSGSTLLSAILSQNPRFHANMSGPLGGMFDTMLSELSDHNEYSVFISNDQRRRMLKGLFDGYYGPEFSADVIFDTNRV
jgi:hypothetical protein